MNEFERKVTKSKNSVKRPMSQSSNLRNVKFSTTGLDSYINEGKFEENVKKKSTFRNGRIRYFGGENMPKVLKNYRYLE